MDQEKENIEELDDDQQKQVNKKKGKKKKFIIFIIAILLVASTGGVVYVFKDKKDNNKNVITKAKKLSSKYEMNGNDLQDFDLVFLKQELKDKNMIYSPLSIKYALSMLQQGAKGDTKSQIDAVIGDYKSKKYVNGSNMSFANAMFIRNTMKDSVDSNYTKLLQDKYNAEIIYDELKTPDNLNNWVSDKTFKLINNLVDDVSHNDFFLVNALAIDMEWKKKIQAVTHEDTYSVSYDHEKYSDYIRTVQNNEFSSMTFNNNYKTEAAEIGASVNNYDIIKTLGEENIRSTVTKEYDKWEAETGGCGEDKTTVINRYMKELGDNYKKVATSTDFKYYIDNDYKLFNKELKEYNGTTLEYIAIMPRNTELNQFVKSSSAKSINELISKLKEVKLENTAEGKVTKFVGGIPFFKYEDSLKLVDDLKSLGIKDVFSGKADLTGIVKDGGFSVDKAIHKANIEFSNDGIKASAATTLGGLGAASCEFEYLYDVPVETIDLSFDKPYMYIIRDKATKEVWFMGAVKTPNPANGKTNYTISTRDVNY